MNENYWLDPKFLQGPLPFNKYRKNLPFFLSQQEKELYERALTTAPDDWHYRTKEVRYDINTSDYRAPEWCDIDWKNAICVFGCSHVFGEGLALDETVCYQLEQLTGRPVVNLGVTGSSPIFSYHNSLILDMFYPTPYAVVHAWSHYDRLPYYTEKLVKRLGPWSGTEWDEWDTDAKDLIYLWNRHDTNPKTWLKFSAYSSKQMWSQKTRYFEYSYFQDISDLLNIPNAPAIDMARDFRHFGIKSHQTAAKIIANGL